LAMYLRSRKLSELHSGPLASVALAEESAESLVVAINALRLLDCKNPHIVVPANATSAPPRKKRKVDSYIPEAKFTTGQRDADVVTLIEMENEYIHLTANLELWRRDPSLIRNGEPVPSAWVTVSKLTQLGLYDVAMYTAKALSVDMSELFQRLAVQCLRVSTTATDASLQEATWLLTDKVSSWPGTPADRGWRYLRQSLERYDVVETDLTCTKAVLETLLSFDASYPPPPWLMQRIEELHPEHLIRTCLRYGLLEEALDCTLRLVRKTTLAWGRLSTKQTSSSSTWLPYSLIDAVFKGTDENLSAGARQTRQTLQAELNSRIAKVQQKSASSH